MSLYSVKTATPVRGCGSIAPDYTGLAYVMSLAPYTGYYPTQHKRIAALRDGGWAVIDPTERKLLIFPERAFRTGDPPQVIIFGDLVVKPLDVAGLGDGRVAVLVQLAGVDRYGVRCTGLAADTGTIMNLSRHAERAFRIGACVFGQRRNELGDTAFWVLGQQADQPRLVFFDSVSSAPTPVDLAGLGASLSLSDTAGTIEGWPLLQDLNGDGTGCWMSRLTQLVSSILPRLLWISQSPMRSTAWPMGAGPSWMAACPTGSSGVRRAGRILRPLMISSCPRTRPGATWPAWPATAPWSSATSWAAITTGSTWCLPQASRPDCAICPAWRQPACDRPARRRTGGHGK